MRKFLSKITNALSSAPRAVVHSVASQEKDIFKEFNISKEDLLLAFRSTPIINRAIRFRADLIVARGFHIEYPDKKSKEIIKEFLKNIKLNSPHRKNLNAILRSSCIDADWSGNGYLQLIPNAKQTKMVKLHPLHPGYLDFQRDSMDSILMDKDSGEPVGFTYKPKTKGKIAEGIPLKNEQIAHLVFETVGDELLGTPLLLPAYRTIERLSNIEWAIAKALYKHGLPTRIISVGDANHEPDVQMINDVAEEVVDLDAAAEYTYPYWYSVDTIDPKWPSRVEQIPDYFLKLIVAISGIPHHILLGEERIGTKSTAESLQRALSLMLDPLQERVKSFVEDQIFRRVLDVEGCDAEVSLTWDEPVPAPGMQYDKIIALAAAQVEGKPLLSWREVRNLLNLPTEMEVSEMQLESKSFWGLPLVAPHAELIWKGRKKALVKSKKFSVHIGEPLYLLQNQVCYGVIRLDSPVEISLKEFKELAPKHLVSEEERKDWWPDYKTLFYYPVIVDSRFATPRKAEYDPHAQVFVSEVKLK